MKTGRVWGVSPVASFHSKMSLVVPVVGFHALGILLKVAVL